MQNRCEQLEATFSGIWLDKEDGTPVRVRLLVQTEMGLKVGYERIDGKGRYELLETTFQEGFVRDESSEPG